MQTELLNGYAFFLFFKQAKKINIYCCTIRRRRYGRYYIYDIYNDNYHNYYIKIIRECACTHAWDTSGVHNVYSWNLECPQCAHEKPNWPLRCTAMGHSVCTIGKPFGHICSFPSISRFGHRQCTCTLLCTTVDKTISNLCMTTFLAVDDNYYSNKIKALKII